MLLVLSSCGRCHQAMCLPGEETQLFLRDVIAGEGPSELKIRTLSPRQQTLNFEVEGRPYSGELFLPAETPRAAILFIPGTTTDGNQDPRMLALARSLARGGFSVLIPDLKNLRELKITPGEIDEIADTFSYLASQSDWAPEGRAGMAAVSYIVGPSLLAARQARIRDQVKFVLGIGAYYDLHEVIGYVTTGQFQDPAGQWQFLEPNAHGKWVLVLSNTDRIANAQDRQTLERIARIKIANPEAPIVDLRQSLVSKEGQALVDLMENRDPEQVDTLISQLPVSVRTDLDALTLKGKDFSQLTARVYLMHGDKDSLIPYPQSARLAEVLPGARRWLIKGFGHVEFNGDLDTFEAWSMACLTDALLQERAAR